MKFVESDLFHGACRTQERRLKDHVHKGSQTLSPTFTLAEAVCAADGLLGKLPDYSERPEETA